MADPVASCDCHPACVQPVCPFTARKLPIKRRNARKNGRIPQHGDLLELKTLLAAVVGLQIIRNLVAPVMDNLKRGLLGRAAGALPGVGNAVNMVTELVVTSAVLIRNCLGVVILVVFVLAGAGPMLHYGVLSLLYRFLSAVSQPISDKRMVSALSAMGEGCTCFFGSFLLRKFCACWHSLS